MFRQNLNANTKHNLKKKTQSISEVLDFIYFTFNITNKVYVKTFKMVVSFEKAYYFFFFLGKEKAYYYDYEIIKKKTTY